MRKRVIILVSGLVQGIFYRSNTLEKAKELNLTGWVKNEFSSSVKIVAEGEEENLEKLIEWTKQGPALAKVDKIEVEWERDRGKFKDFEIRY
ncbi:MAG TPA: acylphosphatase [Candidatus Nealsonbacteria bacterium]|uniref:Acylphosphatase-like domain-containing protein n=1 Tax=marine sediment metagenome TaxID=412755 RepID=A0A0F9VSA8_9ZZZZ|nr:acylphosphatase [Candidatus Nealsonbacteria bacterium]HEB46499.1 acylphosphatase [Candidatus Nealsonbacteria bacterium]